MTPSALNSVTIAVSDTCIINVDGKKKCFLIKIHKSALGQKRFRVVFKEVEA